jgi:DNA-binding HxlR family transcriptional regulator
LRVADIFQKKGAIELLLYLLRERSIRKMHLWRKGTGVSQKAFYKSYDALVDAGLITQVPDPESPGRKKVILTLEGERVAKLLLEIERVLESRRVVARE